MRRNGLCPSVWEADKTDSLDQRIFCSRHRNLRAYVSFIVDVDGQNYRWERPASEMPFTKFMRNFGDEDRGKVLATLRVSEHQGNPPPLWVAMAANHEFEHYSHYLIELGKLSQRFGLRVSAQFDDR